MAATNFPLRRQFPVSPSNSHSIALFHIFTSFFKIFQSVGKETSFSKYIPFPSLSLIFRLFHGMILSSAGLIGSFHCTMF
jgi:hypothetical protein